MADIFISYSPQDTDRIKPIVEGLNSIGLSIWPNTPIEWRKRDGWDEEIEKEITVARAVLVCWSQFYL